MARFTLNRSWDRYVKVPETGAHSECTYLQWSDCSGPVTEAKNYCDTCDGLECEGCLYRHMVHKSTSKNDYGQCCGCLWYYGKKQNCKWQRSCDTVRSIYAQCPCQGTYSLLSLVPAHYALSPVRFTDPWLEVPC